MRADSRGLIRKAAAVLLGIAAAGSLVIATVAAATADEQHVGTITYVKDGSSVTQTYDSVNTLIDAATALGNTELSIDLSCDWETSSRIIVPDGSKWTINLNGHMINRGLGNTDYTGYTTGEVFHVYSNTTFVVNGGSTSIAHKGRLVTDDDGGTFWLSDATASGSSTQDIKGGLITGGACDDKCGAGAIAIEGSNAAVTFNNVTIAGNISDDYGLIEGHGGAVAIHDGSDNTFTLSGSSVLYNHAEGDGGAIAVLDKNNTVNIEANSNISYNSTVNTSASSSTTAKAGGGAIYVSNKTGNTINVKDKSSISNNKTKNHGGAILVNGATSINISGGSSLSNNSSTNDGGAVYLNTDGSSVTVDNSTISGNTARYGGAVYLNDVSTLSILNSAKVYKNSSTLDGGAVYADDSDTTITVKGKHTLADDGASVYENTAGDGGGAIFIAGADDKVVVSDYGSVSNNTAEYDGGGINVASSRGTVEISDHGAVDGNTAYSEGGGIYHGTSYGAVTVTNGGSLSNNTSTNGNGGGLYSCSNDTALTLNDGILDGNKALEGGAVYADYRMNLSFTDGSVSNNQATSGNGGALFINTEFDNDVNFNGTAVNGNTAAKSGGVAFVQAAANFAFSDGATINNNKAADGSGGAIFAGQACKMVLNASTASGNTATSVGGFAYTKTSADIRLRNAAAITGNTSTKSGGAVYAEAGGTITADGKSKITSNTTKSGNGGAVYSNGWMNVQLTEGSSLDENSATSGFGGAVYAEAGASITASGASTISGNSASAKGGAVYMRGSASNMTLSGTSQMNNNTSGSDGGAVFSIVDLSFTASNSTISGCQAKAGSGGAICVYDANATLALTAETTFSSCNAYNSDAYGGAVCVDGGSLNLTSEDNSAKFTDCSSFASGGAIYSKNSGTSTVSGVSITGCKSASGSAIYFTGGMDLVNAKITDNVATYAGAVFCGNTSTTSSYVFALGGSTTVADNTCNDVRSNISIAGGQLLSMSSTKKLGSDAKFGVAVRDYSGEGYRQLSADETFATAAADVLTSDNSKYSVGYQTGEDPQLYLRPYAAEGVAKDKAGNIYSTLAEAIEKTKDGGEIFLLNDVTDAISITGKNLTFDLEYFTITGPNNKAAVTVGDGATVKFTNGSLVANSNSGNVFAVNGGSLTLSNVNANAPSGRALSVESGSAKVEGDACELSGTWAVVQTGGEVSIDGGEFTGNSAGDLVITGGTLSINGGVFTNGLYTENMGSGTTSVSAGSFGSASFAAYLVEGKAAFKHATGLYEVVDAADALATATCVVTDQATGTKVYFENADEAAAYAATVEGATVANVCTVTFDAANGTAVTTARVEAGTAVAKPADPTKTGQVFIGWLLDGAAYDFSSSVNSDITLTASWASAKCTVTFDSAGGTDVATRTVGYGECVSEPEAPTRAGYKFAAWSLGNEAYSFSTPVTQDITLKANWVANTCVVSFDSAGGSFVAAQSVRYGQCATKPEAPTREGYTFQCWLLNGVVFDFTTPVETDQITLTAQWAAEERTVTFDSAGGSTVKTQTVDYGQCATEPEAPTREGYAFQGWELDGKAYGFTTPVTKNITLKAAWAADTCVVSFDSAGGSFVAGQTVKYGKCVEQPANPTRTGYTFKGWKLNGDDYDFTTPVTSEQLTLTASWEAEERAVSFDTAGGSTVETQTVDYGQCATEPEAPTREGYTFQGWELDGKAYGFTTPVTKDITLTAVWSSAYYTVSFDTAGGSFIAGQTVRSGKTASKPADPTRDGYDFAGWQLDDKAYDFSTPVEGNVTLTAAWTANPAPAPAAATSLAKVTGVKAKAAGKKKVKVTWAAVNDGRTGVQIRYSYKKGMKKAKTVTVKSAKAAKKILKKLKKGKKVFIQVRAYEAANGQKIYGAWSAKAKAKVK